jgi:plastocyanin
LEEKTNTQNKMNPMIIVGIILAVLVVGAVVVLGMGANSKIPNNGTENTADNAMVAVDEMEDEAMMKEEDAMMGENVFEVEGGSFYFEPNVIRVAAGEPVTIQLNAVDLMHDFVIDELNVRAPITQGGSSSTVTFTPTTPGEYEFYCSVGNHRAQGMVGTLIVE